MTTDIQPDDTAPASTISAQPGRRGFARLGPTRWLVVGSLLLNLLLAGAVLGHWLHPRMPQTHPSPAMQALPEDRRAALETKLRDLRMNFEAEREQMRLAREASLALLTIDPFDAAAYRAQLQESFHLRAERQRQMMDELVALAESLDPAERAAMAEALRRGPHHPPEKQQMERR